MPSMPTVIEAAKVATARDLWVPAINNVRSSGHWAFVEVTDPWDAEPAIRAIVEAAGRLDTARRANLAPSGSLLN